MELSLVPHHLRFETRSYSTAQPSLELMTVLLLHALGATTDPVWELPCLAALLVLASGLGNRPAPLQPIPGLLHGDRRFLMPKEYFSYTLQL